MVSERRKPILPGRNELEQLAMIWYLCGSPTEYTMPNFLTWGGWKGSYALPQDGYPLPSRVLEAYRE